MTHPVDPSATSAWADLIDHRDGVLASTSLRALFAADPGRAERLSLSAAGWHADFSKQMIDDQCCSLLVELARQTGVESLRDAMLSGERINITEDRAVLHAALRAPVSEDWQPRVDGIDILSVVHHELARMAEFAVRVRQGQWHGADGMPIDRVVNIGIGGSDLGPAMVTRALAREMPLDLTVRYVSNVDPADFAEATADLTPGRTLFIVCSKTFTTQETMANAARAREWVVDALGASAVAHHFVAVSSNPAAVADFGIDAANSFQMWDWVGGRYSLGSAIGLSSMVAIGPDRFVELLAGLHDMDEHFRTAPLECNLPVLMGLMAVWNRSFLGIQTQAVLPYAQDLSRFPAYLQQLSMESNGKRVRRDGTAVGYETGAIVWGEPGTNGQHSFYQLIHQGTSPVACDIIAFARSSTGHQNQQDILVAHALAQASVMAFGRTPEELAAEGTPEWLIPHKAMPGNRPSTVLMAPRLDARTLGALIALYEHSVMVQGAVWGIGSFDQWGVELGKSVAGSILAAIEGDQPVTGVDPSTARMVRLHRELSSP